MPVLHKGSGAVTRGGGGLEALPAPADMTPMTCHHSPSRYDTVNMNLHVYTHTNDTMGVTIKQTECGGAVRNHGKLGLKESEANAHMVCKMCLQLAASLGLPLWATGRGDFPFVQEVGDLQDTRPSDDA